VALHEDRNLRLADRAAGDTEHEIRQLIRISEETQAGAV
jgi:hypothetical protein